ncbi:sigma-70 family RNA polymerase sigma factor [bacterium]|jgi:RNA polymerase primary sigma factor|uniref:Sigma-70 family RNA polymerase sigma factor n=1 Tax=Candidatus Fonsibacter lacus TaxID=2576439 RepID=A0A964UYQ9_9PROT|nr:sigma-70 family RNA polymerase sigma factor [Candidatus Fonsibacter lacus]NBS69201.1 sigma-70 family RNA polymerase sigma factor [bacterium]NCU71535.1 sigma-70 family RNA polymerase sigma factor [Candidatus Fonsibacter lacus]
MSDTLRDYLNQIGKIPLLTAAEEIELGHAIQKMIAVQTDQPSKEEQRILRIGRRAKDRMIKGNLRLVVGVAKKYRHMTNRLTMHDLVQEGNIGLIRAVELFDPARGYKFSTYAYWWIRQGIMRSIQVQDRMIKLPTGAMDALRKVRTFTLEYQSEYGRTPSIAECAEVANITVRAMKDYLAASIDAGSLDASVNQSGESSTYIELIACEGPTVDDEVEQDTKIEAVTQALEYMSPDHRQALTMRYGLDTGGETTVVQIAKTLKIGRDAASKMIRASENEMRLILKKGPPKKHSRQNNSSSLIWGWG